MPEGDTIFRAARTLHLALAGQFVTEFKSVFPKLSRVDEDAPIVGRTVERVESHGKWMSMHFSGDLVLLTHMLMNGSWHIYRQGERWRRPRSEMRILIGVREFVAVGFNVPVAEFRTEASMRERSAVAHLGPDVLSAGFDPERAIAELKSRPDLEVGEALLRQSLIAGLGNVYKSEVCFACKVNPFRQMSTITDAELQCLVSTAQKYLRANVAEGTRAGIVTYTGFRRTTGRANAAERLWVYGRAGEPCRRCGTTIERRKQGEAARVTFWCPECQPAGSGSRSGCERLGTRL